MLVLVAVLVTLVIAWAVSTAQRLDRLHIRLDRSRDALQAALDRRCAVIAATVPELAVQAHATEEVRLTPLDLGSRLAQEHLLNEALVHQMHDLGAVAESVRQALKDADTRVMLALRFYNDAVTDTRALRLVPAVRALRLGGTAALPDYAVLEQLPLQAE
ncbi:hypothetical protein CGLAU_07060 [Corynebacterium glaucum]|uniref:LemA family protein n=1 Tax=Corynebacterium glaucum TaxID=187491 RepID=A0A1Q2HX10_9CORY|nr:hypothetical protein CGLAU_07060 [Corynebacterium glaucum]